MLYKVNVCTCVWVDSIVKVEASSREEALEAAAQAAGIRDMYAEDEDAGATITGWNETSATCSLDTDGPDDEPYIEEF